MYKFVQGSGESFYKLPDNITFSRIIEELSEGVMIMNQNWEVIYASDKTEKFTQIPAEKLVSQNLLELFPEIRNTSFYNAAGNVLLDKRNRKFNAYIPDLNYWLSGTIHHDHLGLIVVIHDLSTKKEFFALAFREENVVEYLNDPLFVIDLENRVKIWNNAAEFLYGWSKKEILENKIEEFLPLRIEGYSTEEFKQLILSNGGWNGEIFQYDRYKSLKIMSVTASPVRGSGNEITGIAFLCNDVTRERQDKIDLVESRNLYKTAVETVREIIFKTDKNGIITFLNPAWENFTGYTTDYAVGKNLSDLEFTSRIRPFNQILKDAESNGKAEFALKTSSGNIKEFFIYFARVTEGNKLVGVTGTMIDMTSSKVFEKELVRHVRILKAISRASRTFLQNSDWEKNLPEVLASIGAATEVDSCLITRFEENSGNKTISVLYEWVAERYDSEIKEYFENLDAGMVNTLAGYVNNQILFCNHKNPVCENLNLKLTSVNIQSFLAIPVKVNNRLWGMMCIENFEKDKYWIEAEIKALTTFSEMLGAAIERNRYEAKILRSKTISENANRVKSEFLAQISHEIRTPINALLSFSSFIGGEFMDKVDDDTRLSFKVIETSGKRIIRTIDLILHMSELQAGTYDFRPVNIDLYEDILNDIYLEHFHEAKKKGLSFSILPLTTDTVINGDTFSVTQIFEHLIENAIKYTKKGSVSIRIFRNESDNLVIEIKDTGIGIAEDYLPRLFELFSQEEQGYTRPYDGNGLGLALVNKYCSLNNAEIMVESKKNVGSTFRVIFK